MPDASGERSAGTDGAEAAAGAPAAAAAPSSAAPERRPAVAVFAGGCFWCLEPVFRELRGVRSVECGYTGGQVVDPDYDRVCGGETGHAEAVRIEFDPREVSFRQLLDVFFAIHDPTTKDRQGLDVGSQYRSAVFVQDDGQRRETLERIAALATQRRGSSHSSAYSLAADAPIVTEVATMGAWYPAEAWHQRFYERNPGQGYCRAVIGPKMAHFRRDFASLRKR